MSRYEYLWRNKWLTADAETIEEMADMLENASKDLRTMSKDGITLENPHPDDDYAFLVTNNEEVAKKHGLEDRREIYGEEFFEDGDTDEHNAYLE